MGSLNLEIQPQLRFDSGSPDRFWSSFAPRDWNTQFERRPIGAWIEPEFASIWYAGETRDAVFIRRREGTLAEIEAFTTLKNPVYSHLNSFCRIVVNGHQRLSISFSPCPTTLIEVMPSDYPVGRPVRAAYMDAAERFYVVEGTSGEKGPFKSLAEGELKRADSLSITFYDNGMPICLTRLDDWSSQAGVQLSPDAGWGFPVNAIEFSLVGDHATDAAVIYLTLASTSMGRGWDTVGHAAGTYRNRMTIERVAN